MLSFPDGTIPAKNLPKKGKTKTVVTNAIIEEGNKVLELMVTQEDKNEFMEESEHEEGEIRHEGMEEDNQAVFSEEESDDEVTIRHVNDEDEHKPSSSTGGSTNNNAVNDLPTNVAKRAKLVEQKGINEATKNFCSQGDKLSTEEMQSMMKFVKFLESQGFITKSVNSEDKQDKQQHTASSVGKSLGDKRKKVKSSDNQQQAGNRKSGNLAPENTTIDGQSEATIYNPAVILQLSDESDIVVWNIIAILQKRMQSIWVCKFKIRQKVPLLWM